jgi:addiction module RelE/StbE family toxin
MRIEWSQYAVADLRQISEYIEQDRNVEAANKVSRSIYDAIQSLLTMPYRGRPGRINDTRELVIRALPYVVIYQVFDERLLILNIVHGAQKWPS